MLGCGAMLQKLVRTQNGPFTHRDTETPEQIAKIFQKQNQQTISRGLDYPLQSLPALYTTDKGQKLISNGQAISENEILKLEKPLVGTSLFWPSNQNNLARCYGPTNQFFATLLRVDEGWKPDKVLFSNDSI